MPRSPVPAEKLVSFAETERAKASATLPGRGPRLKFSREGALIFQPFSHWSSVACLTLALAGASSAGDGKERSEGARREATDASGVNGAAPERTGTLASVVRHLPDPVDGWSVAEATHFRIFHRQVPDLAERAAEVAEQTRTAVERTWFAGAGPDWNSRCDLYLHTTGRDYCQATGVPAKVPGHSTIRAEGGRVLSRRMDLRCDAPDLLRAVIPHEVTHIVLAGRFGNKPAPPWVNEGMAILSEPRETVERHLQLLPRYDRERQLLGTYALVHCRSYPEPRLMGAFYAQSVSLVEFLSQAKSPQTFTRFVGDALRDGYEPALQRHFGWDFDDLEQHWRQYGLGEDAKTARSRGENR